MKKRIKLLLATLMVFIVGMLAFNSSQSKKSEAAVSGYYSGDLETFVTSEFIVNPTGSNAVTEVIPGGTYFVSWYYTVKSGVTGFVNKYRISKDLADSVEIFAIDEYNGRTLYGDSYYGTFFGSRDDATDFLDVGDYKAGYQVDYSGKVASKSKGFASNASLINDLSTSYEVVLNYSSTFGAASAAGDIVMLMKLKITLSSSATSLLLENTEFQMSGADNVSGLNVWTSSNSPDALTDISIGGGSASSSTALSTATINDGTTTSNLTVSGSNVTGTISPNASNVTLNLAVEDSGKVNSVTLNGTTDSTSPYTFNVSSLSPGSSYTGTINVTAQDGTTTATYNLTVTKEQYSVATLQSLTFSDPSGTDFNPELNQTFSSGTKNYTLTVSSNCKGFKMTPTITPGYNIQGITVNGTSATSGQAYTFTTVPSSIKIDVTAQDGSTNTYNISISKYTVDTTVSSVTVFNSSGTRLGTATIDNNTHTITYSGVPYTNNSVYYQISASNANTVTMTYGSATNPTSAYTSGSPTSSISFGSTSSVTTYVKLTDNKTGDSTEYKIIATKASASNDSSIGVAGFSVTSISGTALTGTLSNTTYTVNSNSGVPYDDTAFNLAITPNNEYATITVDGKSVSNGATTQISFPANQTRKTVKVIVTAQDGSTTTYSVVVNRGPAESNSSLSSSNGIVVKSTNLTTTYSGTLSGKTYTLNALDYNVNEFVIFVTLQSTKAYWVLVDGGVEDTTKNASGANQIYTFDRVGTLKPIASGSVVVRVYAQDGTYTDYTINYSRNGADDDNTISNVSSSVVIMDSSGKRYSYTYDSQTGKLTLADNVAYKYNSLDITVTLSSSKATMTIDGKPTFTGDTRTVTIGTASDISSKTISIPIVVTAQDGSTKTYTIEGIREAASTNNSISDTNGLTISADSNDGAYETLDYTLSGNDYTVTKTLPGTTTTAKITVNLASELATMTINGTKVASGTEYSYQIPSHTSLKTYTIPVVVKSESGSTVTYNIKLTVNVADTDTSLSPTNGITIIDDAGNAYAGTWNSVKSTYTITNKVPYLTNTLYVIVNPNSSVAKIYDSSSNLVAAGSNMTWTIGSATDVSEKNSTYTFSIKPEAGPTISYAVKCTREKANDDTSLITKVLGATTGEEMNTYLPSGGASSVTYYLVSASKNASVHFNFTAGSSLSKITFSSTSESSGYSDWTTAKETIDYAVGGTYFVRVTAQNGTYQQYTFQINAADERDDNVELQSFVIKDSKGNPVAEVNGKTFTSSDHGVYTYNLDYTGTYTIEAVPAKTTSHVYADKSRTAYTTTIDASSVSLTSGQSLYFYVQAENETWSNVYSIKLTRTQPSSDAYLTELTINGTVPNDFDANASDVNETYTVLLAKTVTNLNVAFKGVDTATVTRMDSYGNSFQNSYAKVEIQVVAQDGTINRYIINVYTADTKNSITGIQILDPDNSVISGTTVTYGEDLADSDGNAYYTFSESVTGPIEITVPYGVKEIYLYVKTNTSYGTTFVNSTSGTNTTGSSYIKLTANSTTIITTYVVSEYGMLNQAEKDNQTSETYTFKIKREARDVEVRLDTFAASANSGAIASENITFSPDNETIIIQNVGANVGTMNIQVTPKSSKSTVSILGEDTLNKTISPTFASTDVGGGVYTFNITVTAEKASTSDPVISKTYTVEVYRDSIDLSDNTDISSIKVIGSDNNTYGIDIASYTTQINKDVSGKLASVTISVSTPSDAKSTAIVIYTDPDGNQKIYSGNDLPATIALLTGTNTFEIYVKAQNNTDESNHYVIVLNKQALSTNADVTTITVGDKVIPTPSSTASNKVTLPAGTTSIPVSVDTENDEATVKVVPNDGNGNVSLTPGDNTVTVIVQPEDPTVPPTTYTVVVSVDENTLLKDLAVDGYTISPSFQPTTSDYTVTVPYNTTSVDISYLFPDTTNDSLLKVTVNRKTATDGEATVAINGTTTNIAVTVTPKSGENSTTYNITVTREDALTDKKLLSIEFDGVLYDGLNPDITTGYVIKCARNKSYVTITNPTVSTGAIATLPTNLALNVGKNEKTIRVTAQDGSTQDYVFTFVCADETVSIDNIGLIYDGATLVDNNGNSLVYNSNTTTYDFVVGNSLVSVKLAITKTQYAYLYINGSLVDSSKINVTTSYDLTNVGTDNLNTIVIYAISEYDYYMETTSSKTSEYTINIERKELSHDATLKDLVVNLGTSTENAITSFDKDTLTYTISNIGDVITQLNISATATDTNATVSGTGNMVLNTGSDVSAYSFSYPVLVTAEDGTTELTYTINVSRGAINLDDDNTLVGFEVIDSNGITHINKTTDFNASNPGPYNVTIPAGTSAYTINGSTLTASVADFIIEEASSGTKYVGISKQFQCNADNYGKTIEYKVYARSESGLVGTAYTINVTIETPSSDATLKSLTVDGVLVEGFEASNEGLYTLNVPNEKTSVNIQAIVNDSTSTLSGDLDDVNLVEGSNVFIITVKAQDGTTKSYKIQVNRAYPNPKLTTLGITGEVLLDENGKSTTFNPEVYEYYAKVVFYHENADIYATSNDSTDLISGTGVKTLYVGMNEYVVTVTNIYGNSTEYTLHIRRYSSESTNSIAASAKIDEIPEFEGEFNSLKTSGYEYTVANNITSLHVYFYPENNGSADNEKATVEYIGASKLYVGVNNIVVIITAADGVTSTSYVIRVTRSALNFEVDKNAYESFEVVEDEEYLTYKVSVGDTKASDIDFTKYIKDLDPEGQELTVEVLTDTSNNPDEVLLRVSDGENVSVVKFVVDSTYDDGSISLKDLLPLFICLGIVLLVLIAILICVNKDKYGKIIKKSSKRHEKENKRAGN